MTHEELRAKFRYLHGQAKQDVKDLNAGRPDVRLRDLLKKLLGPAKPINWVTGRPYRNAP